MAADDNRPVLWTTIVRSPISSSSQPPVWSSAEPLILSDSQKSSSLSYLNFLSLFPLHSQEFGVEFTISFFAAFGFGFEAYIP